MNPNVFYLNIKSERKGKFFVHFTASCAGATVMRSRRAICLCLRFIRDFHLNFICQSREWEEDEKGFLEKLPLRDGNYTQLQSKAVMVSVIFIVETSPQFSLMSLDKLICGRTVNFSSGNIGSGFCGSINYRIFMLCAACFMLREYNSICWLGFVNTLSSASVDLQRT